MFTLFHGTTLDAYQDIITGKYDASKGTNPWNCSNFDKIYFYDPVSILNSEFDAEPDREEDANNMAQRLANEAGQISNALKPNPENRTVVLEFIFKDDEIYFEDIEQDNSCPNMPWAVQMDVDKFNGLTKQGRYSIKVHFYKFYPKMSLCYLIPIANNDYFNLNTLSLEEKALLLQLKNMECYSLYDTIIYDLQEEEDEKTELLPIKFLNGENDK